MMRTDPVCGTPLQGFSNLHDGRGRGLPGAGNPSVESCMARTQFGPEAVWAPTCQPSWAHPEVELERTSLKFLGGQPNKLYLFLRTTGFVEEV